MNFELLKAIKERGWTQKDFSRRAKTHESIVSRIIRGTWNPTPAQQKRFSAVLGKSSEEIFKRE